MQESLENPKRKRKLVKTEGKPTRTKLTSSTMPLTIVVEVVAESSLIFALVPLDPQQAMELEREDSREVEEVGEVDLPLTFLPLFEPASEPTPSDVVAVVWGSVGVTRGGGRVWGKK